MRHHCLRVSVGHDLISHDYLDIDSSNIPVKRECGVMDCRRTP